MKLGSVSPTLDNKCTTYIPKRICQFMVKACCVAATNDVPVHMIARRAISPTLSRIALKKEE